MSHLHMSTRMCDVFWLFQLVNWRIRPGGGIGDVSVRSPIAISRARTIYPIGSSVRLGRVSPYPLVEPHRTTSESPFNRMEILDFVRKVRSFHLAAADRTPLPVMLPG